MSTASFSPPDQSLWEPGGKYSFSVSLEASRLGDDADGRRYEVIVSAMDKAGNAVIGLHHRHGTARSGAIGRGIRIGHGLNGFNGWAHYTVFDAPIR